MASQARSYTNLIDYVTHVHILPPLNHLFLNGFNRRRTCISLYYLFFIRYMAMGLYLSRLAANTMLTRFLDDRFETGHYILHRPGVLQLPGDVLLRQCCLLSSKV